MNKRIDLKLNNPKLFAISAIIVICLCCVVISTTYLGTNSHSDDTNNKVTYGSQLTSYGSLDSEAYWKNDLGATYSKSSTSFKVWSPKATEVLLNLYSTGDATENTLISSEPMKLTDKGVWTITKGGDLNGIFYTYTITNNGVANETADIYAKATGLNGNRSMVVDLNQTDPDGWAADKYVTQKSITDAIIWEVHIGDFSSSSDSGIDASKKGKYLAFTQKGTSVNSKGFYSTGIDYLSELGVNYVHLLPTFDYDNNESSYSYNWGYNPKNYNVPEGLYSSDPSNGFTRITEFKQMVQSLHSSNIGVIMDVVYNHTSQTENSWFNLTVPNYYYRLNDNGTFADGSACGNETASEAAMFRKYMIDSILYWTEEYHIDGFRFDLMGLHDTDTMNAIRQALNEAGHEDVIIYGEPWNGGSDAMPSGVHPADKENASILAEGIALFNDDFRDSIKGHVFAENEGGFIQGLNGVNQKIHPFYDDDIISSIAANSDSDLSLKATWTKQAWASSPSQVITYASAHDNLSLWDKLVASTSASSYDRNDALVAMNKLSAAVTITSQGGIFFQAGEEFARTKRGDANSYESSILINELKWSNLSTYADLVDYYKGLIELRNNYSPMRDSSNGTIDTFSFAKDKTENLIAYTMKNTISSEEWNTVAVIINSGSEKRTVELTAYDNVLPEEWVIVANNDYAGIDSLGEITGSNITIEPQSVLILVDKDTFEK